MKSRNTNSNTNNIKHLLSDRTTASNINIIEIYQAIRDCSNGIIDTVDIMIPEITEFKEILLDWDPENDDHDDHDD